MKRVLIVVTAFLLSFPAFSQENLTSKPVGFVRVELPAGAQTLVSMPFVPFDNSINAVLSGQLTGSTNADQADKIFKWDATKGEYITAVKADGTYQPGIDGNWFADIVSLAPSDMTLSPGEGFYILNNSGTNETVFLPGLVLLAATNELTLAPALNLIGYTFSSSVWIRDTTLGDIVEGVDILELGKGYWCEVASDSGMIWQETRPYADVFPSDDGPPQITGMSVIDGGSAVKLMIRGAGSRGERLDIFYQDVPVTNGFDTLKGWQMAQADWDLRGQTDVSWEDQGSDGRPPVNQAEARFYLLGSAIDNDGDGIPDAREQFVYGTEPVTNEASGTSGGTTPGTVAQTGVTAVVSGLSFPTRTFYIEAGKGDDSYSGLSQTVAGTNGPTKTINGCLQKARPGDTIYVRDGFYRETVDLSGRGLQVLVYGNVTIVSP